MSALPGVSNTSFDTEAIVQRQARRRLTYGKVGRGVLREAEDDITCLLGVLHDLQREQAASEHILEREVKRIIDEQGALKRAAITVSERLESGGTLHTADLARILRVAIARAEGSS